MSLLTTSIGSLPKPASVRRARWRHDEDEIDGAELLRIEQKAMAGALQRQQEIGLDVLVDGQFDRSDMISYFAEHLDGVEPAGFVRCWGNRYYRRPVIDGALGRPAPITVERWKAAQAAAGEHPVKAILTGPYTLMDWSFDEHYDSRRSCCLALADLLAGEARDLVAAGARELQIDEPALAARPDEWDLVVEGLQRVLGELQGDGVRRWLHVCYGDMQPLMSRLFTLPVEVVQLELANSDYQWLDHLPSVPEGKMLGAGVIDALRPEVESTEALGSAVDRLLQRVPAERLCLVPDAGLRALPVDAAEAKLRALVAAARV